jgi:hypothetical protein
LCCVCRKDGSMERKVTWRTKGFKQYKNGSKGKNPGQGKKKIPAGTGGFSLRQNVQTGSRAHPAFYSMGTDIFSRCKVDHSPHSSAKVANEWSYTFTPRTRLGLSVFHPGRNELRVFQTLKDIPPHLLIISFSFHLARYVSNL